GVFAVEVDDHVEGHAPTTRVDPLQVVLKDVGVGRGQSRKSSVCRSGNDDAKASTWCLREVVDDQHADVVKDAVQCFPAAASRKDPVLRRSGWYCRQSGKRADERRHLVPQVTDHVAPGPGSCAALKTGAVILPRIGWSTDVVLACRWKAEPLVLQDT